MTDDELPVELVKAVRQAQARDELGWVVVPPEHAAACASLFRRMLLMRNEDGLVFPTPKGFAIAEHSSMTTGGRR